MIEAVAHARLVFGLIPRLPQALVGWPSPLRSIASYLDLSPPEGPAALVRRVEEMTTVLERLAANRRLALDGRVRRTYAFCETAEWIGLAGLRGPHPLSGSLLMPIA